MTTHLHAIANSGCQTQAETVQPDYLELAKALARLQRWLATQPDKSVRELIDLVEE